MSQPTSDKSGKQFRSFQSTSRPDIAKKDVSENDIWAKPLANRWHNLITTNFVVSIGSRINRGTCEIYANDMQVRVGTNSVCVPDMVVVNGEPEFTDESVDVLQNPTLVVDIFSTGSKTAGRTQRLEAFLAIPKIKECLLVNENELRIEHYARQNAKQWIYRIYDERDDVITLDSIQCKISMTEVYSQVKLKHSSLSLRSIH